MRDYRGKRLDNGEWIFGSFTHSHRGLHYITETMCGGASPKKVDPVTVGQCTGISAMDEIEGGDVRPILIYEGDIVEPVLIGGNCEGFSWGRQVVIFDRGAFCVKDRRGNITPMCNYSEMVRFKLRGNVWDNPELMEVNA